MDNYVSRKSRQPVKKTKARFLIFFIMLALIALMLFFSISQFFAARSLSRELEPMKEEIEQLRTENERLEKLYDEFKTENEKLHEENRMMRSSTVKSHGNRETNKVAITIDDGGRADLINEALDELSALNINATFFPVGTWIELDPDTWKEVVERGHELGNHTYSHKHLNTLSDDEIHSEIDTWQTMVNNALGYEYKTYFFRPPGLEGFYDSQTEQKERLMQIISEKGMFVTLWDVDHYYGLSYNISDPDRIAQYVIDNTQGGSIVLMHFRPEDIAALPAIVKGLREQGLEPCSLSEMLLSGPSA